jgi:hypothetical protein
MLRRQARARVNKIFPHKEIAFYNVLCFSIMLANIISERAMLRVRGANINVFIDDFAIAEVA